MEIIDSLFKLSSLLSSFKRVFLSLLLRKDDVEDFEMYPAARPYSVAKLGHRSQNSKKHGLPSKSTTVICSYGRSFARWSGQVVMLLFGSRRTLS